MERQSVTANDLRDGSITFNVKSMDGKSLRTISVDCLLLKLCCEEAETAHGLKDGQSPPAAFLKDLAGRLQGLGVEACSPSIAYQLWHLSGQMIAALKKNTNETPNSPSGSTSNPTAKARGGKSRKGKR